MNETSLLSEYQKLIPDVKKIFVLPQIPLLNRNTSYLYQLYKDFIRESSVVKVESFNASSLPKILLSRIKSEKSILHYHWFEFEDLKSLIGIKWKLFWIILFKLLGGKIVWTVHNYHPHHKKYLYWNLFIRRLMAKLADSLHIHCGSETDNLSAILDIDKKKFFVVKHPDFPAEIFEKNTAVELLNRKYFTGQLNVDNKIFLMFGAIAEYKGIKEVVEIFKNLHEKNKLIIAGFVKKGNPDYFKELKNLADNRNIFLEGRLIPDKDVPYFLNSADYVIFNYRDILTSGGVVLAMNYKKNIIAPSLGCIKEMNNPALIRFDRKEVTLEQVLQSI